MCTCLSSLFVCQFKSFIVFLFYVLQGTPIQALAYQDCASIHNFVLNIVLHMYLTMFVWKKKIELKN